MVPVNVPIQQKFSYCKTIDITTVNTDRRVPTVNNFPSTFPDAIFYYILQYCGTVVERRQWRRNVSQWDGSSRPTFKSGTTRNAFCRPTFWPQTAYCTYD